MKHRGSAGTGGRDLARDATYPWISGIIPILRGKDPASCKPGMLGDKEQEIVQGLGTDRLQKLVLVQIQSRLAGTDNCYLRTTLWGPVRIRELLVDKPPHNQIIDFKCSPY